MGNVAKYQHGWNMTFTVVELLMIIPKSTYLSISLPYFSIYHFFSLTLFRFFIEFLKERQVDFENVLPIDMGQILSIPFVLLGLYFVITKRKKAVR